MFVGRNEKIIHIQNVSYHQGEYKDNKILLNSLIDLRRELFCMIMDDIQVRNYCKNLCITKIKNVNYCLSTRTLVIIIVQELMIKIRISSFIILVMKVEAYFYIMLRLIVA